MKFLIAIAMAAFVLFTFGNANASTHSQKAGACNDHHTCFNESYKRPTAKLNDLNHYAGLPRRYNTGGERAFVFSPRHREWAAYDANGYKVSGGIANGGKPGYRTPSGTYRVYNKAGPSHVSSRYPEPNGGSPMPYAMHFTKAGHAIHGSPYISNRNGSHGCIRVKTNAARWLNQKFIQHGTKVIVQSY